MIIAEENNKTICAICRDEKECNFRTRCGHNFHYSCMCRISGPKFCPHCKQAVSLTRWRENIIYKIKNLDEQARDEILVTLSNLKGIDIISGKLLVKPKFIRFDKQMLERLTEAGWDINSPEEGGAELLEKVCENDDLYRLNLLLHFGLKLDNSSDLLANSLEVAERNKSSLVISRLKDCIVCVSDEDTGDGPLHLAAREGNLAMIKDLISKNVDVNVRNINGVVPLHIAAAEANLEIATCLLENGAIPNSQDLNGRTPMYEACRSSKHGYTDVIKRLLEFGATTVCSNNDKNTLLHTALISKRFDIAEILISKLPDINYLNVYNESCLHLAASSAPKALLLNLIEAGANVNLKDYKGQTPLHKALIKNSVEVVEFLLEKGADVNASNNKSEYPIHLALRRIPSLPFVKALMRHGADLTVKDQNGTNLVELMLDPKY